MGVMIGGGLLMATISFIKSDWLFEWRFKRIARQAKRK
jgi:hypothetical protein